MPGPHTPCLGVSSVAAVETGPGSPGGERHGPVTDSADPETGGDTSCHTVIMINSEMCELRNEAQC